MFDGTTKAAKRRERGEPTNTNWLDMSFILVGHIYHDNWQLLNFFLRVNEASPDALYVISPAVPYHLPEEGDLHIRRKRTFPSDEDRHFGIRLTGCFFTD